MICYNTWQTLDKINLNKFVLWTCHLFKEKSDMFLKIKKIKMWFLKEIWFVKIRSAICKKRKRKEIWFVKINSVSKKGKKEEEEIWLKKIKSVVCRVKK